MELGTPDMQTELCGFYPLMISNHLPPVFRLVQGWPSIEVYLSLSQAAIENHVFHISEIMGLPW